MEINNVLIVGVGGIGFRHFQSMMTIQCETNLSLIDIDEKMLEKAREYEKDNPNKRVNVRYYRDFSSCPEHIDVAIIATSSLQRRTVFDTLIRSAKVKSIIFEKFLFPREEDYYYVEDKICEIGIDAYVNCPRRLFPGYMQLKKELCSENKIKVLLSGSNWGLACNAIHIVDAIAFLVDCSDDLKVDSFLVDDEVIESRRNGYVEFTGRMICRLGEKADIIFDCYRLGEVPSKLTIFASENIYTIIEGEQMMIVSDSKESRRSDFLMCYQSDLTSTVVSKLLIGEPPGLTSFDETKQWHIALLKAFQKKYNEINSEVGNICPIT